MNEDFRSFSQSKPPDIKVFVDKNNENGPNLQSNQFDWNIVTEMNPELVNKTEDVGSMSKIISAFLLCQFSQHQSLISM